MDVALTQESHLNSKSVKSFSNPKYEVVASSSVDDKTKGVIVIRRSLDLNITDIGSDNEGKIAFVKVIMSNMKIIFVSAYSPADYDKKCYSELSNLLMNSSDYYLVIGADMNTITDPMLDKSNPRVGSAQLSCSKALQQYMLDLNLVDVWRFSNPGAKKYTFFSNIHKSYSRIDYIFVSSTLIPVTQQSDIILASLSDRHAVNVKFLFPTI